MSQQVLREHKNPKKMVFLPCDWSSWLHYLWCYYALRPFGWHWNAYLLRGRRKWRVESMYRQTHLSFGSLGLETSTNTCKNLAPTAPFLLDRQVDINLLWTSLKLYCLHSSTLEISLFDTISSWVASHRLHRSFGVLDFKTNFIWLGNSPRQQRALTGGIEKEEKGGITTGRSRNSVNKPLVGKQRFFFCWGGNFGRSSQIIFMLVT